MSSKRLGLFAVLTSVALAACGDDSAEPGDGDDSGGTTATGGSSSGASGTSGASGSSGASGASGTSGAAGASGTSGAAGAPMGGANTGGAGASGPSGSGPGGAGGAMGGSAGDASSSGAAGMGGIGGNPTGGSAGSTAGSGGGRGGTAGSAGGGRGGTAGAGGAGSGGGGRGGAGGSGGTSTTDPTLPGGLTSRFPRGDQTGVCNDVALRLDFTNAVTLGSSGRIQIFAASGGAAVDSIDMATMRITDTIGGRMYNLLRPVFVDGRQAVAYFHQHRLQPNTQYYVTVDASVFSASGFSGITGTTAWRFTTGPAPAPGSSLSVQAKGGGTHCMVQGALDTIPASNTSAVTVTVGAGIYHEIVYMSGKRNVTLRGADRAGTVITYANNDMLNAGTSGRPMMFITGSNGFTMENLTVHNTTPQGGSQAEALRSSSDQTILRRVNLKSLQDTLLSGERLYVSNSLIEGNVDYIWGSGPTYFDKCEIKTVGRAGYLVQSRNGTGYGYVFVDSRLTSDSGITGNILARIDASAYPNSHVAFINCEMGPHIAAGGWTVTGTASSSLRFWEYQSKTPSGANVSTSSRHSASRQISASEAAMMRDKTVILNGWNPAP